MLAQFTLLAALLAAGAGCSAPDVNTTLAADDPANPAAPQAVFKRPANILATAAAPASPPIMPMKMPSGAMPGMSGMEMPDIGSSP